MSFVLGFGSVEQDVERVEGERVTDFLKDKFTGVEDPWYTDELAGELTAMLTERKKELDDLAAEYHDSPDRPDRYSTFYFSVLHNVADLVVVFKFSHISRSHPMSPDGWALLQHAYPHYVSVWEFRQ